MTEASDLAIVGAGPAGLAAAVEAAEHGLQVFLIDLHSQPGGQYFKQVPAEFQSRPSISDEAGKILSQLAATSTRLLAGTVVWGIFPEQERAGYVLCLYGPRGTPRRLVTEKVILAPGAHDRPLHFPGWTLPGVMTAGAAQLLIKSQRVLPGRRVLLSGTGPLQLAVASQLIAAEAEVVAILDANPFPWEGWRRADALWGQWARLREGWEYWRTIREARVPVRWQQTVVRAEGNGRVERAVIGGVGDDRFETLEVDTICLGYGLVPSSQLPYQAGAEHRYQSELGSYAPVRDEWLQTTLPGLFVTGDGAGIGGKDVALLEGRLAAAGAAGQLGCKIPAAHLETIHRDLKRQRRFTVLLDALFPFPASLWSLMTDDTVLCRCEEVTVGKARQAIAAGAKSPDAVKALTRVGMGRCQGRMCGGALSHLIAQQTGLSEEAVGYLTPRPPVLPVPVDGLLEEESLAS